METENKQTFIDKVTRFCKDHRGRMVYLMQYKYGISATDAEDVLQDAFCDLLANRKHWGEIQDLSRYLFKICANKAFKHKKDKSERRETEDLIEDYQTSRFDMTAVSEYLKDQTVVTSIDYKRILELVDKKCYEILKLAYYYGYKWKEVYEQIDGCASENSAKVTGRNCVSKLKQKLSLQDLEYYG